MKPKAIIATAILASLVLLVAGCAQPQSKTPDENTPQANRETQEIMHIEDWKDQYPDVYESFMSGADELKDKDGKPHSHVLLKESVENGPATPALMTDGLGCITCKSSDLNVLYEEYGDDLWTMPYEDSKEDIIDYWGCYMCHENDPGNTVAATAFAFRTLAGDEYFNSLAPADAACGQCHNYLDNYPREIARNTGKSLETFEPYRYGTDADAIMKASLEDGDVLLTDEDGVQYFYVEGHADVEMFQGSNHQSLGLTCASCHMPTMKNDKGEKYVSHNASGSPLKNEAALEYCLTCHKAQGVDSTEAMVAFVKGKQGEQAKAFAEISDLLEELHGLIVAGTDDADIDAKARELYLQAQWYQGFSNSAANVPGTKAPHSFETMMDYYIKAKALAEEGIALYSA